MLDIIMDRRSIRKFTPEKVTEQQVEQLLQAAVMAPSAQNRQPWHFIVCDDKTLFQQFQQIHPYSKMLDEAPLLIASAWRYPTAGWPSILPGRLRCSYREYPAGCPCFGVGCLLAGAPARF